MTLLTEISNIRIKSQGIGSSEPGSAIDILSRMGAIQAQDFSMAKWALGVRMALSTIAEIEASFNRGDIIRTHLMRPTWHLVSASDVHWLLELTAPRIKSSLRSRERELELSDSLFRRSNRIIEKLISGGLFFTREDFTRELKKAKINTGDNRLSHLLLRAELEGILCSGPIKDKKLTYASLNSRVAHRKRLTREEAMAELASRYFQSRYPATLHDFTWWSGLSMKDAKTGMESARDSFITENIGSKEYMFPDSFQTIDSVNNTVHLLPAYDEFLISYRDRSASLQGIDDHKTISSNGIFYPVVVVNGQVAGVWKQVINNDKVSIETALFNGQDVKIMGIIEEKASILGLFHNKKVEIRFKT
jgi:hypothetical protein